MKRGRARVVGELAKAGGEESVVDGGEEHGGVQAVLADGGVAMGAWDACD